MPTLHLPWPHPNLLRLGPYTPRDRRGKPRHPLAFPLHLHLGAAAFPAVATDLSAGGMGLMLEAAPDALLGLYRALAEHERGALGVTSGRARLVVRVRIARVHPSSQGVQVGAAFEVAGEFDRLIQFLDARGVPAHAPSPRR